ncbi:uncharacterized protein DNG_04651 [Cephalotrichum gorgonifer]|uniref:FAD-dependent urate hydroxylase HpyO/Asp monooxygenase CreE-like FAD/NAD(P)-binding domain-containing protein n=1 Tax=Cephalotrichum gorgonifer TaxID=2041049 RepID=A0AAE8SUR4_9PEZI|nr:uncharacterized protein DNG_04651 [Cephalotrichum gorgonifer]
MGSNPIPISVAICGGGACALALLIRLLEEMRHTESIGRIYIYESLARVGPGATYSEGSGNAIINQAAESMGLHESDPLHFVRWVESTYPQFKGDRYPPRHVYGSYLASLFASAQLDAASRGLALEIIRGEIVDLRHSTHAFVLQDNHGRSISVDKVVLALGNFPRHSQPHLAAHPGYFGTPWPLYHLDNIPRDSRVCVVGTRLSGIDAAFHLVDNGHTGPIYLVSRGGRLPTVQGLSSVPDQYKGVLESLASRLEERSEPISLRDLSDQLVRNVDVRDWPDVLHTNDPLRQLSQDMLAAEKGEISWRSVADSACPVLERYWNILEMSERVAFIKNWGSLWNTFIHAMPHANACRLQNLLRDGRVQAMNFDVIQCQQSGFTISSSKRRLHADIVIEATGIELDVTRIQTLLLTSLVSSEILEAHPLGGFSVDQNTLESTTTPGLYVIGSLTSGVHFYTTGIDRNITHASRIARHLIGKTVVGRAEAMGGVI